MNKPRSTADTGPRGAKVPGVGLFFRLADALAGPSSPAVLAKALSTCGKDLSASSLGLFVFNPDSSKIARLVTGGKHGEHIYFQKDWQTSPNPIASFFARSAVLERVDSAELFASLFATGASRDQDGKPSLLLVSLRLPTAMQGLLVITGEKPPAPDCCSQELRDIGELLFAATDHCIQDSNSRSSADRMTEILNFSDSIYASWHERDGWHYHNIKGLLQLGYQKEEISLRSREAHNPMHTDDWKEAVHLFENTLRKGVGYAHDYRAVDLKGASHWYNAQVTVTATNNAGGARELTSISRDVNKMRSAAQSAVDKAQLEQWLLTQVNAIFSCNDFASMNKVLREVGEHLGVERCSVRVVDPETLFCNLVSEWHSPGREAIAAIFPDMTSQTGIGWVARLIELGQTYVVNDISTDMPNQKLLEYHRAINVEASITQPMLYGEQLTGYLAILSESPRQWTDSEIRVAREIADTIHMAILRNRLLDELRATDERFQMAMENSTHGLWDHDGHSMYYSPHFYEMLGYPREDKAIPLAGILDYIHPDDHELLRPELRRQYTSESGQIYLELRHVKRDGSCMWMLSRGKVVERDSEGKALRVVGVNMDITEQKRTLAELRKAREAAEEANRSKSEFLERMSHEIRTPMNAIIGMSYLTLETELDEQQQAYLQDIDGAAKSLLHIIDDILDFSKIEAGELTIVSERFNLKEELDRLTKLMSGRALQAGNDLSYTIDDDVPEQVVGDKHRLGQVLTNLLGNAIKFTKKGKVTLAVRCVDSDARINSVTLLFSVSDSGIGLSEQQIATLFEPFTQAEGSTSRKYGGTGLGLSICKHLVETMGGSIQCNSLPQVGTTFEFTIVFKQNLAKGAELARKEVHREIALPFTTRVFHHKKILLAEDNLVNQRVAKGILNKFAVEVVTAANGAEAIELLERGGPGEFHAVLMDIEMPVLDGLAATRAIRQRARFRGLPVIAMTAHAMAGDRERCMAAGMDDYIPKPINPDKLLQALGRAWERTVRPEKELGEH